MKIQSIKNKKGFSLIELLVVIAVIGIIAAIALPAMSGIFDRSRTTKNRRNAQSISATFNAARQAGAFTVNESGNDQTAGVPTFAGAAPTAAELATLATYFSAPKKGKGVDANSWFSVSIDGTEAGAAASFLAFDSNSGQLTYKAGGDGL